MKHHFVRRDIVKQFSRGRESQVKSFTWEAQSKKWSLTLAIDDAARQEVWKILRAARVL